MSYSPKFSSSSYRPFEFQSGTLVVPKKNQMHITLFSPGEINPDLLMASLVDATENYAQTKSLERAAEVRPLVQRIHVTYVYMGR